MKSHSGASKCYCFMQEKRTTYSVLLNNRVNNVTNEKQICLLHYVSGADDEYDEYG